MIVRHSHVGTICFHEKVDGVTLVSAELSVPVNTNISYEYRIVGLDNSGGVEVHWATDSERWDTENPLWHNEYLPWKSMIMDKAN